MAYTAMTTATDAAFFRSLNLDDHFLINRWSETVKTNAAANGKKRTGKQL